MAAGGGWIGVRKGVAALIALTLLLVAFAAPLHLAHADRVHDDGARAAQANSPIANSPIANSVFARFDAGFCHDDGPGQPPQDDPCCDFCTLAFSPGLALAYVVTLLDWPRPAARVAASPEISDLPRLTLEAARSRAPPMPLV